MPFNTEALDSLITEAGGQDKLAKRLGVGQPRISELLIGANSDPKVRTLDSLHSVASEYGREDLQFYIPPSQEE